MFVPGISVFLPYGPGFFELPGQVAYFYAGIISFHVQSHVPGLLIDVFHYTTVSIETEILAYCRLDRCVFSFNRCIFNFNRKADR